MKSSIYIGTRFLCVEVHVAYSIIKVDEKALHTNTPREYTSLPSSFSHLQPNDPAS